MEGSTVIRTKWYAIKRGSFRVRYLGLIGLFAFVTIMLMEDQLAIKSFNFDIGPENDQGESIQLTSTKSSTTPYTVQSSLLNDKTIAWDPSVDRMWLDDTTQPGRRPPAMILLTSYGWNRLDQTDALLHFSRQTRESEFLDGIVNHPWFHPTAWDEIENGDQNITIQSILGLLEEDDLSLGDDNSTSSDSNELTVNVTITRTNATRFYVFFDLSSNCDIHYPKYHAFDQNLDTSGGRVNVSSNLLYQSFVTLDHRIWQSKFMTQLGARNFNRVKVIYLDCHGEMHPSFAESRRTKNLPVVVAHISGNIAQSDEAIDMGLVPPLLFKAAALNESDIENIYSCAADFDDTLRPYYITYIGNFRSGPNGNRFPARGGFADLNDNKRMFGLRYFLEEYGESAIGNVTYENVLKRSIYSGAPRGDNKYSYRFTEVLASGGIPIVMADDWMLPFRPELVNWSECVILIPEKDYGLKMLKYIAPITQKERCERRKKCYDIYRTYIETGRKVINGIVQGLELVALGHNANMTAIHCDPAKPDSDDCNPLR